MKPNIVKKKALVENVFNKVFDKYDLMNDILSFGSHRLWKRQMMSWLSPKKKYNFIRYGIRYGRYNKTIS